MILVKTCRAEDRDWLDEALNRHFRARAVARQGELVDASALPCAIAWDGEMRVGFVCWAVRGRAMEIVALASDQPGRGAGQALLTYVGEIARHQGTERLYLFTTNDNIRALAFYQRFGMVVTKWHPDAVKAARALKPAIPLVGENGIPIRDEVELDLRLS